MQERILWSGYPSWRQFSWLYLMSALVAWRAVLFRRLDLPGWEAWLLGSLALLAVAPLLRRWAGYELTPGSLIIRNGYTGRVITERRLTGNDRVEIKRGPIAAFLGLGTLVVTSDGDETGIRLRGLSDPEHIKQRIEQVMASIRSRPAAVVPPDHQDSERAA